MPSAISDLPTTMKARDPHSEETPVDHGRISRTIVNFWLDAGLLLVLLVLGNTAVIVQFVFPPGVAARGWSLWGMTYGQWTSLQFAELCVLGIGVLVHVMLHWTWVCGVVSRRILGMRQVPDDGIRTIYGVGFLIVLLLCAAAVIAAAMFSIRDPEQQVQLLWRIGRLHA